MVLVKRGRRRRRIIGDTVITIRPDGMAEGLYTEEFSLDSLGELREVQRASNVEWEDGEWVARVALTGEEIGRSPVRSEALDQEREYFNQHGFQPSLEPPV